MAAPCYLCGVDSVLDGLCSECYNKEHPLILVEPSLRLIVCKRCGSVKIPGGWKTLAPSVRGPDQVLEAHLKILLKKNAKHMIKGVDITYDITNRLDRVLYMTIIAKGRSHPTLPPHDEYYETEVRIAYETCTTCSKMSGGYYEAILQIRAVNRPVSEEEETEITSIVEEITIAAYGKDTHAFVIGTTSDKYGINYWIGSEHLCRRIATKIEKQYLASRKENYKLYGQDRGGKEKFRITILVRLPRFGTNDFVLIEKHPCLILSMGSGRMNCLDLVDRNQFTITIKSVKWRSVEFLAPSTARQEFMIVSHTPGQSVQLMDSKTFEMIEVAETVFDENIPVGETIQVLLMEEIGLLPLPSFDNDANNV